MKFHGVAMPVRAAMRENFSLLVPGEGREINHGAFNEVVQFHLGQRYSRAFVQITLVLHNIAKGQVKVLLVPRACTSKS